MRPRLMKGSIQSGAVLSNPLEVTVGHEVRDGVLHVHEGVLITRVTLLGVAAEPTADHPGIDDWSRHEPSVWWQRKWVLPHPLLVLVASYVAHQVVLANTLVRGPPSSRLDWWCRERRCSAAPSSIGYKLRGAWPRTP